MLKKHITAGSILLLALCQIAGGILLIVFNDNAMSLISFLVGIALIGFAFLKAVIHCLRYFSFRSALKSFKNLKGRKYLKALKEYKINKLKAMDIVFIMVSTICGILLLNLPVVFLTLVPLVFSVYCLILCVVYLISFCQMKKDSINGRGFTLLSSIISFGFFVVFLLSPLNYIELLTILMGCLLIVYGAIGVCDFITEIDENFYNKYFFTKIKIPLPIFLTTFIPHQMLTVINKAIAHDKTTTAEMLNMDVKKTDEKPDLEIFVHVSSKGVGTIGHSDLCFDGEVLSYGGYDDSTARLFGTMGDGCYFKTKERDRYLDFCIKSDAKTMFVFGIKLTPEQKDLVAEEIKKLEKSTYRWKPPFEIDRENGTIKDYYDDYGSRLVQGANVTFYKFSKGTYKSYFVLNTNCVKLPEQLLHKSGAGVLAYSGIISPGTFYTYLNREFLKKNSCVISRTVYNNTINKINLNDDGKFSHKNTKSQKTHKIRHSK